MPHLEVNGQIITREELRLEAARLRQQAGASSENQSFFERELEIQSEAEQLLIDRALLEQEAARSGLEITEGEILQALSGARRSDGIAACRADIITSEARAEVKRRLAVDKLLERWCQGVKPPSPAAVRDYYTRNRDQFHAPERVRVSQIIRNVEDEHSRPTILEEIQEVHRLLRGGADFAQTADRHSDCRGNGGDLGYFPRGIMVEEFDAVVFAAPVGALTDVFSTRFGYHIAFIRDHRPEGLRSFEEVRAALENMLLRQKQDQEVGRRLNGLRARAVIRKVSTPS